MYVSAIACDTAHAIVSQNQSERGDEDGTSGKPIIRQGGASKLKFVSIDQGLGTTSSPDISTTRKLIVDISAPSRSCRRKGVLLAFLTTGRFVIDLR